MQTSTQNTVTTAKPWLDPSPLSSSVLPSPGVNPTKQINTAKLIWYLLDVGLGRKTWRAVFTYERVGYADLPFWFPPLQSSLGRGSAPLRAWPRRTKQTGEELRCAWKASQKSDR